MRATTRASLHALTTFALLLCLAIARASENTALPAGSNVIHRLLERGEKVAKAHEAQHYTYDKRSLVEELNESGKVVKSTEKLYKVMLINGLSFPRLVKIQGRDLTPAELEKQNKREEEFRKKVSQVDVKKKAEKKESWATDELVSKFTYTTVRRETLNGRATLAVAFTPKAKPGTGKSIEDRVLSCISGTVWVDEEDAEFTRLESKLRASISMGWFGMFGSLSRLDIVLVRARMPDGVWVNTRNSFIVNARKLLETIRSRTTEECSGFKRE
jgi:hypothetical protein